MAETLLIVFIVFILLGMPISIALGVGALGAAMLYPALNPIIIPTRFVGLLSDSYLLLSAPLFILAGNIAARGGVARVIIDLATAVVGRFRGGLAYVNVVDSMVFGGISGSAVADVSALGTFLIPQMVPPTVMLADTSDLPRAMDELGMPLVVKIPDGSFSRGVHKVDTQEELRRIADELFEETDLVLAQKFLPTEFDWRVGILSGQPLFVCQYRMARGHWQIAKHRPDGSLRERRLPHLRARPGAARSHRHRGAGGGADRGGVLRRRHQAGRPRLHRHGGQRQPNLEHGVEDQVGKDEIWTRLLRWFIERFRAVGGAIRPTRLGNAPSAAHVGYSSMTIWISSLQGLEAGRCTREQL